MRPPALLLSCVLLLPACGSPEPPPEVDDAGVVVGIAVDSLAQSGVDAPLPESWNVTSTDRTMDAMRDVIAYRVADEATGVPASQVVLFARCLGDRTQVDFYWGVALGDDVYDGRDERTKRVLLRFFPRPPSAVVWHTSGQGVTLLVRNPVRFLRELVGADALAVQTTSSTGQVLFAAFEFTPLAFEALQAVADACQWVLDPELVLAAARQTQDAVLEGQRERVLDTYIGNPIRDGLERYGVEYGDIFVDLPAPVDRAFLGFGVTVTDVETAVALGYGIVCTVGTWVGDELVLRECYIEGMIQLDAASEGKAENGEPPR